MLTKKQLYNQNTVTERNNVSEPPKQTNTQYLDLLRFAAISMVILLHITAGVLSGMPEQMTAHQTIVYELVKELCTGGVPLFFMISGVLFLNPQKELTIKKLFTKYIRRIALAILLFGTGFALLELVMVRKNFRLTYLWTAFLNMLERRSWAHMWYLYALLGLYLFLPLLKIFAAHAGEKVYAYVLLLLFVANSVVPFINETCGIRLGILFPTAGIYLFYYLAGYYLHTWGGNSEKRKRYAVSGLGISGLLILVNQICGIGWEIDYDSPVVVVLSVSLFCLLGSSKRVPHFMTQWRGLYFSIYLIHTVFLNAAYKGMKITPLMLGGYILLPVFFTGTFALSLAAAYLMKKIPLLNKYVL